MQHLDGQALAGWRYRQAKIIDRFEDGAHAALSQNAFNSIAVTQFIARLESRRRRGCRRLLRSGSRLTKRLWRRDVRSQIAALPQGGLGERGFDRLEHLDRKST